MTDAVSGVTDVTGGDDPGSAAGPDRDRWWAWGVGLVAALLVVGPGLGPGAWLNVDLVVTDATPVPRGVWGLGPELPRRVPFALPFAWLSALVPGALPWKLAAVTALASGTAGTWRLVTRWAPTTSSWVRAGAGLVAGVGPFATTRLGAGHLGLTFALALLPWALPALLRPADHPARTVAWALALGACGPFGGTVAVPALACGLVGSGAWRSGVRAPAARATIGAVVAQGPWLVPTVIVASLGTDIGAAGSFPTDAGGAGGLVRVLVGHGFWRSSSQIGGAQGWEVPVAGIVLAALAAVGWRRLPAEVRVAAGLAAVGGLVVAAASAVPGLDEGLARLVDGPFAALRESQRLLALWLVVAAPAAAVGADHLGRRLTGAPGAVATVAPLVVGVLGAGPALWGIGGTLDPVELPEAWAEVRAEVRAAPGPVMVVPWAAYPPLETTGGRPVAQPLAIYLGGDVVASSDPGFGDGSRERSDAREPRAAALAARLARDEPVSDDLVALGIRWVVEVRLDGRRLGQVSAADPGLRPAITDVDISLHEVRGWAPARDPDGDPVAVDRPVAPIIRTGEGTVVVAAPGSGGWRRGGRASTSRAGLLALPDGTATAWYPGAAACLAADGAALGLGVVCLRRRRLRRRRRQARGTRAHGG